MAVGGEQQQRGERSEAVATLDKRVGEEKDRGEEVMISKRT